MTEILGAGFKYFSHGLMWGRERKKTLLIQTPKGLLKNTHFVELAHAQWDSLGGSREMFYSLSEFPSSEFSSLCCRNASLFARKKKKKNAVGVARAI